MGLTNINKDRTEIFVGKAGTGKTTTVKEMLPNAVYQYANVIDIKDIFSVPIELGIIIEDIHYKPMTKEIVDIILKYRGTVVLTSINQKSIPKEIKKICKIKRVGSKQHIQEQLKEIAPRSEEPFSYERDVFSLINEYLKSGDRDLIRELLLFNKPADTQIVSWLNENLHPNKLLFVDGVVKRRWPQRYFYEMLAYCHEGKVFRRANMPTRGKYSKVPRLLKRVGLASHEHRLFKQLIKEDEFRKHAMSKYNNEECRLMGLGEKKTLSIRKKKTKQFSLEEFL
tara:strand:- start:680 stop:1528 length:849 start_codon:yes stop_codon:yes gene_type:complete